MKTILISVCNVLREVGTYCVNPKNDVLLYTLLVGLSMVIVVSTYQLFTRRSGRKVAEEEYRARRLKALKRMKLYAHALAKIKTQRLQPAAAPELCSLTKEDNDALDELIRQKLIMEPKVQVETGCKNCRHLRRERPLVKQQKIMVVNKGEANGLENDDDAVSYQATVKAGMATNKKYAPLEQNVK